MRVMPIIASARVRRFTALALVVGSIAPSLGCRSWIIRERTAESISLAPVNFEVPVNGSLRVVASAFDRNDNSIGGKNFRFSSSNSTVATITDDGLVIGVSPGTSIIAAEVDDARGETTVTVVPEVPSSILVSPSPVTLRRGNVRDFTATPRTSTGSTISGLTVIWESSNSSIASVTQSGQVTAVAPGNVAIAARVGQVVGLSQVTITEIPIGAISLSPQSRSIQVGETFIPDVTLRDTAQNVISRLGRTLNWTSSNELNATVSSTGVVRGVRSGSARITVSSPDNPAINAFMDVTVSNREVRTLVIGPRGGFLRLDVPRAFGAALFDSTGTQLIDRVVTWTSLTPTVLTISPSGIARGLSVGTARFTARVDNAVDTVQFTVTKIPVGEVELSPANTSVLQGKQITLNLTVRDSTGAEVSDRDVVWATSNPLLATVSNTGVVTGVSPGNALISATSEGRSDVAGVSVLQVPVDSIRLVTPSDTVVNINSIAPGNTYQIQLSLRDADGGVVLNRDLLINSTSPGIATGIWNPNTRILTVGSTSPSANGATTITVQALSQNGNPQGKETTIRVNVTFVAPPPD